MLVVTLLQSRGHEMISWGRSREGYQLPTIHSAQLGIDSFSAGVRPCSICSVW